MKRAGRRQFAPLLLAGAAIQVAEPPRDYQPRVVSPGLDTGVYRDFLAGELTPDGKLLLAYRNWAEPGVPNLYRAALTVGVMTPDNINLDANGRLAGFDDVSGSGAGGSGFTFPTRAQSALIHYSFALTPSPNDGSPEWIDPSCRPANQIPAHWQAGFKLDPTIPTPPQFGNPHFTFALPHQPQGNPFRTDNTTTFEPTADGAFLVYDLFLVRTHAPQTAVTGAVVCSAGPGELVTPTTAALAASDFNTILVSQNFRVVLSELTSQIVQTQFAPSVPLKIGPGPNDFVRGIEPTMTEDGRLILFHGNGADNAGFQVGSANVTYVFNRVSGATEGWTPPRSITELPTLAQLAPLTSGASPMSTEGRCWVSPGVRRQPHRASN